MDTILTLALRREGDFNFRKSLSKAALSQRAAEGIFAKWRPESAKLSANVEDIVGILYPKQEGNMLNINLIYSATALAAPQSFRDGMEAAVLMLERHILDNITVNINVGYGENSGNPLPGPNVSNGGPGPTANGAGLDLTYTALRAELAGQILSPTDQTVLLNLPMAANIEGQTDFRIGNAQARALGLANATDATVDGAIGMGTGFTGDVLFAGALHELTHAMGRIANWLNVNWSVDLFRWNSADNTPPLTRVFGGDLPPPNATAAYFSIDGGTTRLADFGVASDPGDWLNGGVQGVDPFNEIVGGRGLTMVDLIIMDALGFQVGNQAPTVIALTSTINEDGPSYSQDLLQGASDFETDTISVQNLANSVTTTGGRVLSLGTDYTLSGSGSTIALTASGFFDFQSLAVGQSDTCVFNYNCTDFLNASTPNNLTLNITGVNDAPVAIVDSDSAGENETKSFDVLANDTDVDFGATESLVSPLGAVTVISANPQVNGINAASAFTIDTNQIKFTPGTLFDHLAAGQTATALVNYTMQDDHGAQASSTLTLTVNGANDAPVIQSGGGGDTATYFVKKGEEAITKLFATDPDSGDVISFSIVGGSGANRFSIDPDTGELSLIPIRGPLNKSYLLQVQASDGQGGTDLQDIVVKFVDDKMVGDAAHMVSETFVFHPEFDATTIKNFDLAHDFLQFDKGMFSADTAAAVLAAAHDSTQVGRDGRPIAVEIDVPDGHVTILGVTKAELMAHASDILFV
jgi:VCBS repeat-containing protein